MRPIATRAGAVLGAVWIGGHIACSFPHEQVFVFPIGSAFPNAIRFSASRKQSGDSEPRGGVTLAFSAAPPRQIRQHADLPHGDYVVNIEVAVPAVTEKAGGNREIAELGPSPLGVQTNIERRVTLLDGETMIALAAGGF